MELGTHDDWDGLALQRGLPRDGIELAVSVGVLRFGHHQFRGVDVARAWFLLDQANRIVQLRRLDGARCRWKSRGDAKEAKSYTWFGSDAHWPVGLANVRGYSPFVLLTEGGPDLLAAFSILAANDPRPPVTPVAMLGGSCTIASDALQILRGHHVRLIPHVDRAGDAAERRWAHQIKRAGASVDVFDLTDEMTGVKDLNDFVRATPRDGWKAVLP